MDLLIDLSIIAIEYLLFIACLIKCFSETNKDKDNLNEHQDNWH